MSNRGNQEDSPRRPRGRGEVRGTGRGFGNQNTPNQSRSGNSQGPRQPFEMPAEFRPNQEPQQTNAPPPPQQQPLQQGSQQFPPPNQYNQYANYGYNQAAPEQGFTQQQPYALQDARNQTPAFDSSQMQGNQYQPYDNQASFGQGYGQRAYGNPQGPDPAYQGYGQQQYGSQQRFGGNTQQYGQQQRPNQYGNQSGVNNFGGSCTRTCHKCGQPGHIARNCEASQSNSGANQSGQSSFPIRAAPAAPAGPAGPAGPAAPAAQLNLDPWTTPGSVTNNQTSAAQLVIQTAIDNCDTGLFTDTLNEKGYKTDVASEGTHSTVLTNFLSIEQRPTTIFVYNVEFVTSWTTDGTPVFVSKKFDQQGLFTALLAHASYSRLNAHSNWVTDYANVWSTTPLFDRIDYTASPGAVPNVSGVNENSKRPVHAKQGAIHFRCVIDLQKTIGQLYGESSGQTKGDDESALLSRGLNAVVSKFATDASQGQSATILRSGANKFYDLNRSFDLGWQNRIAAFHGFFVSVRPGADQLLLNVGLRCSPFWKPKLRIGDLLSSCRDTAQATSTVKGLKVQLASNAMQGHAFQGIEFITNVEDPLDRKQVNVAPKRATQKIIRSANDMHTFAHSPYRQPLMPNQTSNMIKGALKEPRQHISELQANAIRMFGLDDADNIRRLRDCFGMTISQNLKEVPCRFLKTPGVLYNVSAEDFIKDASWNLQKLKVREPTNGRTVKILDLSKLQDGKQGGDNPLVDGFEGILRDALASIGITATVPPRCQLRKHVSRIDQITEDDLATELQHIVPAAETLSTSLVIVIPKASYDFYSTIKRVADLRLGIQTTCVTAESKVKEIDPNGRNNGKQHCANIGLKLNLKGDGANHKIARTNIRELYTDNGSGSLDTFECDAIVIGADVTHPMGHCAPACPSVAAVVGSVDDHFAKFPGSMRVQRSRQEPIAELHHMVKERLLDWADNHKDRLPESMLFYRDGVGENQFEKIRKNELEQLQQAYDMADRYLRKKNKLPDRKGDFVYPCKITFVVVGKRHNTRFFPQKAADQISQRNGNVRPGMVVDQVITHPYIMDFYLQSHQPLKGTGRSAHYFVLKNGMGLTPDRLQDITHAFCYNYARATKGVSYCGPAYYADRLCDRGRAYVRDWLIGKAGFGPSRAPNNGEDPDAYKDFVAGDLHGKAYYRPDQNSQKYDGPRQNPWHPNLDKIMFYL